MDALESAFRDTLHRLNNAAERAQRPGRVRLLAASKAQPAEAIRALAGLGQRAFGENYVQEALAKQAALAGLDLEWHLIGPLQSNKARPAAEHFDWVQTVDRPKLAAVLSRHRPPARPPLNVLIEVNIDQEPSKSGCTPEQLPALAATIAALPGLRLRGLMAIPAPHPDPARRREAFARMRRLYERLAAEQPAIDTLSMGMSEDFELAIAEGASLVRVGTAVFGPRERRES